MTSANSSERHDAGVVVAVPVGIDRLGQRARSDLAGEVLKPAPRRSREERLVNSAFLGQRSRIGLGCRRRRPAALSRPDRLSVGSGDLFSCSRPRMSAMRVVVVRCAARQPLSAVVLRPKSSRTPVVVVDVDRAQAAVGSASERRARRDEAADRRQLGLRRALALRDRLRDGLPRARARPLSLQVARASSLTRRRGWRCVDLSVCRAAFSRASMSMKRMLEMSAIVRVPFDGLRCRLAFAGGSGGARAQPSSAPPGSVLSSASSAWSSSSSARGGVEHAGAAARPDVAGEAAARWRIRSDFTVAGVERRRARAARAPPAGAAAPATNGAAKLVPVACW